MSYIPQVIELARKRNPAEWEFHQAVEETLGSLEIVLDRNPHYQEHRILERLIEPERVLIFRVSWMDDRGGVQVNRAFRVEMNSAVGPFKGGLRFHSTVYLGTLKFLAFEQVFKNSLTTLPLGGAKGGSDFNTRGKSDAEVQRFCQSFMTKLAPHINPNTDIPGGDVGVGPREIGYLFGQYKRLRNEFTGALTDKSPRIGGAVLDDEAPGYGLVYFASQMLATWNDSLQGKTCLVSGSGKVALHAAEKINSLGGKVVALSDSNGTVHDPDGMDEEKIKWVKQLKFLKRRRLSDYVDKFHAAHYHEGRRPWSIPCDCAFPCAMENDISGADARTLLDNGCFLVAEGANMPTDRGGVHAFLDAKILYGPSKAANAGGVVASGLEIAQNAQRLAWSREEVETQLETTMRSIHTNIHRAAEEYDRKDNLVVGANIAAFTKIADAMIAQGVV